MARENRVPQPDLVPIGTRIRERRLYKKKTQEWLAAKLGLSNKSVSNYELGIQAPPVDTLKAIAKLLDVPVMYFLDEQDYASDKEDNDHLGRWGRILNAMPTDTPERQEEKRRLRLMVDQVIDIHTSIAKHDLRNETND